MPAMPGAGQLRERVQLQRASNAFDAIGGSIETWSTVATLWAHVVPMSASEQLRRQELGAEVQWKVTTRYRGDVTSADRFIWRGRTLLISSNLNEDLRRRFSTFACGEPQVAQTQVAS